MQAHTELLALRLWLGLANLTDIDDWLEQYVNQTPQPDPDVLELFELHSEQLVPAFLALVHRLFGFEPASARGSQVASVLLAQSCEAVLSGQLPVPRFCDLVAAVDAKYFDPSLGVPYPEGLSELWNGCDWCDDEWSLETQPHLRETLEAHVARVASQRALP